MKLIKDLTAYVNQVQTLYKSAFTNDFDCDVYYIIKMIDLHKSFGYIDDNDQLISMVLPVERTITDENNKTYTVVNLTCLATHKNYLGHGYGIKLMHTVADLLVDEYDSVVWQTENWDLYKDFDMVECTNKRVCTYIPGLYPTPMLIIWDEPRIELIHEIENASHNKCMGVSQTTNQIQQMIDMYVAEGMKFISNPCAYIWYDPKTKHIEQLNYSSLPHLTWIMHHISPTNKQLLLFDEPDLSAFPCLAVTDQYVCVTKTYKKSKMHFKHIKLNDYMI